MSNGIAIRQNEEKSIYMLAAQRQLYSDAKRLEFILKFISVWLPFLLSIIIIFFPNNNVCKNCSYILSLTCLIFSNFIENHIEGRKQMGAFIQQKFDIYVYSMSWNDRIFGQNKNVNNEIATYSHKIIKNSLEKEKLYNWYSPDVDQKNLIDGILSCQRVNLCWDVRLRKRFKYFIEFLIVSLIVIVICIGLWNNETILDLLFRTTFVIPMLNWLLNTVKFLNKDMDTLNELDNIINNNKIKTMDDLQDIQKIIFEHRKRCYTIPNYIYKLFKENDEDDASKIVNL